MASIQNMTRQEVEHGLLQYRSRHYDNHLHSPAEAYDFNIKIRNINPPAVLRQVMSAEEVDIRWETEVGERLQSFMEMIRGTFNWVSLTYQMGRSGGWLTVVAKPELEVIDPDGTITARMTVARRRLSDVQWIEQKLEREKRNLVRDAAGTDFWGIKKQDWSPRR
jgi:hypothetical protein